MVKPKEKKVKNCSSVGDIGIIYGNTLFRSLNNIQEDPKTNLLLPREKERRGEN